MKRFAKFIYLLFSILFLGNLVWVVYHWNTYESYRFLNFDIPKHYYLPLQALFAGSFFHSYLNVGKEDEGPGKL